MSPMVNSINITEACARALIVIASSPAQLSDFDARVPRTLAKNGLAEIDLDAGKVRISTKGLAALKAINAKGGGETKAPRSYKNTTPRQATARSSTSNEAKKPAVKRTKRESPPPTGVVDFDALRRALRTQFESDLASIDRTEAIHLAIAPEGA